MSRLLRAALIVLLSIGVAGCWPKKAKDKDKAAEKQPPATTPAKPKPKAKPKAKPKPKPKLTKPHPGSWAKKCPEGCDDGNICTKDICLAGVCVHKPKNGTSCDDGLACTVGDHCFGTKCHGKPSHALCEDGSPCTMDKCHPKKGCKHLPVGGACDDGDLCTAGDVCKGGGCLGGAPVACNDGNPCTDDSCDPATGCTSADNAAACNDGNACTAGDGCAAGACVGGAAVSCDDGNPCTDDACDPATGCVNTANSAACDDGNACTAGDTCAAGACVGGGAVACDDGNLCTDDGCEPTTGCVSTNNTAACDDGNACTADDTCSNGGCSGAAITCDDGDQCTNDSCDSATGCVAETHNGPCDDGDACTTGDMCWNGACQAKPVDCDDGDQCTVDSCDSATGCASEPHTGPCDDGNACTTGDMCWNGSCEAKPVVCDDGNGCTDDSCAPATGCVFTDNSATCDDGDACTAGDSCAAGACAGAAIDCDDGDACTSDSCDSASGCVYGDLSEPEVCDGADNDCNGDVDDGVDGDYIAVTQGGQSFNISALASGGSHTDFYGYDGAKAWASDTGHEVSDRFTLLLHEDGDGDLALMVVSDASQDGSGGQATLHIAGIDEAELLLKNDPNHAPDTYDMESGIFTWKWFPCCNDGLVIGSLDLDGCITITPQSLSGVTGIDIVDGSGTRMSLDSMSEPITICRNVCCAPQAETCDGQDNDCDGVVDNGLSVGETCLVEDSASPLPEPCSAVGALACAGDGGTMCADTGCSLQTVWQLGSFDYGSASAQAGATEYPTDDAWTPSFDYTVAGTGTTAPAMPGYLYTDSMSTVDPFRPLIDGTAQLNVHFTLGSAVSGAAIHWSRYGTEANTLSLDGAVLATTSGAEGKNDVYELAVGDLAAGDHVLTITYDGGGAQNGNYLDAIRLVAVGCDGPGDELCGNGLDDNCDGQADEMGDCSDGDACNGTEACVDGYCQAGPAPTCDDGDVCTADSCDPGDGCQHEAIVDVEVWAVTDDAQAAPALVAGDGWILTGATWADMFEHKFTGSQAYIDHFLDMLLLAAGDTGADPPVILGFFGAYDGGDMGAMLNVMSSFQSQGYVAAYDGVDISAGAPLDITAADLEGVDVVVLDAAPDAPQADFFVLTDGAFEALQSFQAGGGAIVASAYTMVHWNNYLGWGRQLANTQLSELFGGVLPNIDWYAEAAVTTDALGAGNLIATLNYAEPGLSTAGNPWFHFFWALDTGDACIAP